MGEVKGYLIIRVEEATGAAQDDSLVWEPTFLDGFVKVEVRGAAKTVKKQTTLKKVEDAAMYWGETLILELYEGSNEMRLLLCREKKSATRVSSSVVAACGIFVSDIIEAVPIDKYFELFKPGAGGEGGFIRIGMDFVHDLEELTNPAGLVQESIPDLHLPQNAFNTHELANNGASKGEKKKGFPIFKALLVLGIAAAGVAAILHNGKKDEKKKK